MTEKLEDAKLLNHSQPWKGNQLKSKCSHQKIVWDLIAAHVRVGKLVTDAVDLIHAVHGPNASVKETINKMRKDHSQGTLHPSLHI